VDAIAAQQLGPRRKVSLHDSCRQVIVGAYGLEGLVGEIKQIEAAEDLQDLKRDGVGL